MQPWDKNLTDQKIADVMTYERSEWGNSASPVTVEQISAMRKELANHPNHSSSTIFLAAPDEDIPGGAPAAGAPPKPGEASKPAAPPNRSVARYSFPIGRAEDVSLRWQHHVIEILREHRGREKCDRAQRFVSDVDKIVFRWCRQHENAARTNPVHRTIFHVQFPVTGDDVLRFFSGIGVPAEPFTGLNLVHDRGRGCRAVSAIDCKCAGPMNRLVVFRPDFSAFQFI